MLEPQYCKAGLNRFPGLVASLNMVSFRVNERLYLKTIKKKVMEEERNESDALKI